MSDSDLKEKETSPQDLEDKFGDQFSKEEKDRFGDLADNDQNDSSEEDEIPFTQEDKPRRGSKIYITKKKAVAGGVIGLLVGGVFGISTILQGPGQIIHASKLLSGFHFTDDSKFMNGRTGKLIKHIRTRNDPQRRNLGYLGNIGADHFENKLKKAGIDPKYSQQRGTTGRLQALEIDPNTEAGKRALAELRANNVPGADGTGPGRVRVGVEGLSQRQVSGVVSTINSSAGMDGVSGDMSRRLLRKRAGYISMFHPLKRAAAKGDEAFAKWARDFREKNKKTRSTGSERTRADLSSQPDPDGDGPEVGTAQGDIEAKGAAGEAASGAAADFEAGKPRAEIKANFKAKIGTAAGVVGIASIVCGLDKIGDSIPKLKHQNMVLPLIRTGMSIVTMGAQIQNGDSTFSMDELRVISDDLYKLEEESEDPANDPYVDTSFFADASIQTELGQEVSGIDAMAHRKPNTDKPLFFDAISKIVEKLGGNRICRALTSTIGGYIGDAVDIGLGFATGGGTAALAVGTTAAGYAASALFMDDLIGWLVGAPIDVIAQGSELGGIANYGVALAARDSSASHGGIDLSRAQASALREERLKNQKLEMQNKSLFARYFDLNDTQSLVAKTLYENPTIATLSKPNTLFTRMMSKTSIFSVATSVFSSFTPKANAATEYDYGFAKKGFSLEEINDPAYDDPYKIADEIEPQLATLNEKYGECFNMTVDPTTGVLTSGDDVVRLDDQPAECLNRSDTLLTKYRFYLADMTAMRAITCFEGLDDDACGEVGFGSSAPTASAGGGTEVVGNLGNLECPPNMTETKQVGSTTYYKLPDAPGGEYSIYSRQAARFGHKDLVCTIYTASKAYKQAFGGKSTVSVGDLNAAGHKSHKWGVAVDLDAQGEVVAADNQNTPAKYSPEATIELGKAFVNTGKVKNIWYCGKGMSVGSLTGGDGTVEAIRAYAASVGKPITIKCLVNHYNHFHIDINTPHGDVHTP